MNPAAGGTYVVVYDRAALTDTSSYKPPRPKFGLREFIVRHILMFTRTYLSPRPPRNACFLPGVAYPTANSLC